MVDWNTLLNTKYAIQQQNADTSRIAAQAQANLANANANEVGANAISNRTQQAQQTALLGKQTRYFGPEAEARIGGLLADTALTKQRTTGMQALLPGELRAQDVAERQGLAQTRSLAAGAAEQEDATRYRNSPLNPVIGALQGNRLGAYGLGYSTFAPYLALGLPELPKPGQPGGGDGYRKGTARVPAKRGKNPKVDSEPAMLAPDEAVLNKGAADTMGRGLIAALNRHGAAKMGMA